MSGNIYNVSFYHTVMGDSSMELFPDVIIIRNLDVFSANNNTQSKICISNHLKVIIRIAFCLCWNARSQREHWWAGGMVVAATSASEAKIHTWAIDPAHVVQQHHDCQCDSPKFSLLDSAPLWLHQCHNSWCYHTGSLGCSQYWRRRSWYGHLNSQKPFMITCTYIR